MKKLFHDNEHKANNRVATMLAEHGIPEMHLGSNDYLWPRDVGER